MAAALRLLVLTGLAAYNLTTFHENVVHYGAEREAATFRASPHWLSQSWLASSATWPANWKMFTFNDPEQVFVDFEGWIPVPAAQAGGGVEPEFEDPNHWQRLPMERWFPARWDSGYRWDKGGYNNPVARRGWLLGACAHANEELALDEPGSARVAKTRATVTHWKKSTGQAWQPEIGRSVKVLGELTCPGPGR